MTSVIPLMSGLLALALPGLAAADAVPGAFGTLASTTSYACAPADETCNPFAAFLAGSVPTVIGSAGGAGINAATTSTGSWPTPGSASGTVALAGGLAVPVLKAGAASQSLQWLGGQALAIQAYTYTGTGETLSLNWSLSGSVVNPDSDGTTGLAMYAAFVDLADLAAFPDLSDPLAVALQVAQLADELPTDDVREFTTSGGVSESGSISYAVTTGQQFYLLMGLLAGAGGADAMAESLSTLVSSFDGSPQLQPLLLASSVPLPATAALALLGLLLVPVARCRR